MIDKLLTTFDRSNAQHTADFGEKTGNFGLGLLRIAFGRTVTVEKISNDTVFTTTVHSTIARVVAIAIFILALPLTLLLAGIGCVGTAFSKSHEQIFNSYIQTDPSNHIPSRKARARFFDPKSPAAEAGNLQSTEIGELPATVIQTRKIPPVGSFDTTLILPSGVVSIHGSGQLFSDSEIVEKLDLIKRVKIGSKGFKIGLSFAERNFDPDIYASCTKHGKAIIQQQGTRGCTAATAAMLIMDNGKKPDLRALESRNLGSDDVQIHDIQKAGLTAIVNSADTLLELRNLIIQNDSCIVSVSGKLGGHVLVVDKVSKDLSKIRLRDPYHGWEITVGSEAFLKEWHGGKAIQVKQPEQV